MELDSDSGSGTDTSGSDVHSDSSSSSGGRVVVEMHTGACAPRLYSLITRVANGLVQRTLGVCTVLIGYIGVRWTRGG